MKSPEKLRIHIISLFPEFFDGAFRSSLLGKAIEKKIIEINLIQLRDFAVNKHNQVDDTPYGGGSGMVLMVEPIHKALQSIKENVYSVLLTPRGVTWNQEGCHTLFEKMKDYDSLALICGHYEGIDERVMDYINDSISIGDYVLSGGEPAALCVVDSLARLVPDFMGNYESLHDESFKQKDYLEYPQYTRPPVYEGKKVPDVLLSGHHENIRKWREDKSKEAVKRFRRG